jgi:hypothetical protein
VLIVREYDSTSESSFFSFEILAEVFDGVNP